MNGCKSPQPQVGAYLGCWSVNSDTDKARGDLSNLWQVDLSRKRRLMLSQWEFLRNSISKTRSVLAFCRIVSVLITSNRNYTAKWASTAKFNTEYASLISRSDCLHSFTCHFLAIEASLTQRHIPIGRWCSFDAAWCVDTSCKSNGYSRWHRKCVDFECIQDSQATSFVHPRFS